GGTPLGDQLRTLLLASGAEISPRAEALLFMTSRAELVDRVVGPALGSGRVVVCDRFIAANVVYQGHARGLPPAEIWEVGRFATGGLIPDITVILDLPVEQAAARRGRTADRMESRGSDYLLRVREGFLAEARAQPDRFLVIDASPDVATVQARLR